MGRRGDETMEAHLLLDSAHGCGSEGSEMREKAKKDGQRTGAHIRPLEEGRLALLLGQATDEQTPSSNFPFGWRLAALIDKAFEIF